MTKKEMVIEALNSYYLNSKGNINEEYLNDTIQLFINNTKILYFAIRSTRQSVKGIVWQALRHVALDALKSTWGENDMSWIRSDILNTWLRENTKNVLERGMYAAIADSVEWVEAERVNYRNGKED